MTSKDKWERKEGEILPGELVTNRVVKEEFGTQTAERSIAALFGKNEFKRLSQAWGLYEREFGSSGLRRYIRDYLGEDHVGPEDDKTLAAEFTKKSRADSAKFGHRLYDLMRVEAANLTEAECRSCESPVYNADTDTVFSKLNSLEKINPEGDPDLIWKDHFSMKCGSCGAPGSNIDLEPMTSLLTGTLGHSEVSYYWPFQRKEEIGVHMGLDDFINRAILAPFREGVGRTSIRILDRLSED